MSKENEPLKTEEAVTSAEVETEAAATGVETEITEEQSAEETNDETAALREELEAEQNKYLRLLADYDNFKRRVVKDRQEAEKFRSQSLLSDLLPVLDNFERALSVEAKSEEAASLQKGLEMVRNTLLEAVNREGLEEVKAVGETFDPHVHQAVMQEKDENAEPGTVLQELQKGYTLKGRVLRPAMVKVNE
ncbi:nucleotide exchange factor GrpE [Planococcus sp. N028]|uniref:Protein GrpE n=1 Tax=Planococcus shixiaomingii TaxID=3058393 RepID=A0ABT8MXQ9_9BACL|nr:MULTISPECIES: nucleotide exchange factor GrpE [unclassified Planococcus (in: firmicutes)]MDN7240426.1 nucleotide exchange factor GrpE [Planococcus sp. N028]WKA56322.1 nucleotide exchange factor GrpE [Planococcus sp. N022]